MGTHATNRNVRAAPGPSEFGMMVRSLTGNSYQVLLLSVLGRSGIRFGTLAHSAPEGGMEARFVPAPKACRIVNDAFKI
jgi:hypothetical protein